MASIFSTKREREILFCSWVEKKRKGNSLLFLGEEEKGKFSSVPGWRRNTLKSWKEKWSYRALCKKTKIVASIVASIRNILVSSIECSANLQNINLQWEPLHNCETSLEFSCQNRTAAAVFFRVSRLGAEVRWYCAQSCPTLYYPMDCSPPGFSVHWIFQARILDGLPCPCPSAGRVGSW